MKTAVSKKQLGLTFLEFVVALVMFGIFVTLVVPSFQETIRSNQLKTEINKFISALNLARSESVKRRNTISLCKSSDGAACGSSSVNWEDGWIVFTNNDNDNVVDTGEIILRVFSALDSEYTLRGSTDFSSVISYNATGATNIGGRIVLCEQNDLTHARAIFINATGRIRNSPLDSSGTPLDPDGNSITSCTP